MGQQQLILLVLATVIVGLAVVVGIRAATENKAKANADALTQDLVRMASDAQMWKQKPHPFGGQAAGTSKDTQTDFTGATLTGLGYPDPDGDAVYVNTNGSFEIGTTNPLQLIAYSATEGNVVTVCVSGTSDADIESTVQMGLTTADASGATACSSTTTTSS